MLLKFLCAAALVLAIATAAPRKRSKERTSALYVKDSDSGQLRFLTGSGASINQLITQKQDLLEQLRPTGLAGAGVTPIIIDLGGTTSATTTPNTGFTTGTGGGGNGGLGAAANASPIGELLPQIVGQAVVGGGNGGVANLNRPGNRRRRVNRRPNRGRRRRRRPVKRNRNSNPQVFMVRSRQI